MLVVPARARRRWPLVAGVVLGVLTVLRVLDMAFFEALDRPFDSVVDWRYAGSRWAWCATRSGGRPARCCSSSLPSLLVALLVLIPLAAAAA